MRHIALLALVSASLVLIVNWNGTVGCGFRDTAAKIPYLADGSNLAC